MKQIIGSFLGDYIENKPYCFETSHLASFLFGFSLSAHTVPFPEEVEVKLRVGDIDAGRRELFVDLGM